MVTITGRRSRHAGTRLFRLTLRRNGRHTACTRTGPCCPRCASRSTATPKGMTAGG